MAQGTSIEFDGCTIDAKSLFACRDVDWRGIGLAWRNVQRVARLQRQRWSRSGAEDGTKSDVSLRAGGLLSSIGDEDASLCNAAARKALFECGHGSIDRVASKNRHELLLLRRAGGCDAQSGRLVAHEL